MAVGEQHQVKISNIFTAVKADVSQDFYRAWVSIERISDFDEDNLGYLLQVETDVFCVCVCVCVCLVCTAID
jgi:hypothetical protein